MGRRTLAGEWITERLRQVTDAPTWASGLPSGVSSSDLLVQLADAALALYWQTGNFTVLHMVTGSRAAAIVASQLPATWQARWQTLMWQAVAAAYVTVGAPSPQAPVWPDTGKLSWQNVLARAVASLDDHVIKLVHCCWREGSPGLCWQTVIWRWPPARQGCWRLSPGRIPSR